MKAKVMLSLLALFVGLVCSAVAAAATINFEEAADRQVINNSYPGVAFSADDGSELIAFNWGGAGFSTTSSPMVLTTLRSTGGWVSHLNVAFSQDITLIGAWFGNDHAAGVIWTVEVFDSSGNPVGSNSITSNGNIAVDQYLGFVGKDPFRNAVFSMSISDKCIVLDDLFYDGLAHTAVAIPVPPAVWLLASGLAGIVALRRRLTK